MEKIELDWHSLSAAQRKGPTKALYSILRKLHAHRGGRFDDLFEQAQGVPLSQGIDPYSNIKRGVYDRNKMRNIHEWLAVNHFAFAQSEAPELFQYPRRSAWDVFLESYTVEGGLRVVQTNQLGIASRKPPQDGATPLRISQPFLFELTAPEAAYAMAFEEHEGTWHPMALGETDTTMIIHVGTGTTHLPQTSDGVPIPLMEHDHTGRHRFAFVLCFGLKPLAGQKAVMDYANDHRVCVMKTETRIVP